jgi:endonuclease YncB( thermonuclease family)
MKRLVKKVIDGDTFEVFPRIGNSSYVRLAGLNAPKLESKRGILAYNRLKKLIEGKTVTIVPKKRVRVE